MEPEKSGSLEAYPLKLPTSWGSENILQTYSRCYPQQVERSGGFKSFGTRNSAARRQCESYSAHHRKVEQHKGWRRLDGIGNCPVAFMCCCGAPLFLWRQGLLKELALGQCCDFLRGLPNELVALSQHALAALAKLRP